MIIFVDCDSYVYIMPKATTRKAIQRDALKNKSSVKDKVFNT